MMRITSLLAWMCLFAPAVLGAQAASPMTLAEAVGAALASHPTMQATGAGIARAAAGVRDASSSRWPSVAVETSAIRFAEPMVVAPLHGFDPQSPPTFDRLLAQGAAAVSYALVDAARSPRIARAEAIEAAARLADEGARHTLIARTVSAYVNVVAARDRVTAHAARITALERERDRAAQLFAAGRAARVILLRAEATLAAAQAEAVVVRGEADVAARTVARLTAMDPATVAGRAFTSAELVAGADVVERSEVLARALTANAELEGRQRHILAAEAGRAQARALRLPRVQLSTRYVEYAGGSGFESGEWQGGVLLSYPLFTGGATGAAHDRANAELAAARADLALVELDIAAGVDAAIARLDAARERIVSLEAALARSEEVVRIERLALDAGAGIQTDYLNAEADLLSVRSALTDARRVVLVARIELARLEGALTGAWLARNLESGS